MWEALGRGVAVVLPGGGFAGRLQGSAETVRGGKSSGVKLRPWIRFITFVLHGIAVLSSAEAGPWVGSLS